MSTRFEILKNGERVCVSGIDGDGVLSVMLNYVKHRSRDASHHLQISGLGASQDARGHQQCFSWPAPNIAEGDQITICILPGGAFDQPFGLRDQPSKIVDDPDLGRITFSFDAWGGEINLDTPPIKTARIHLRGEETGPSQLQRDVLRELVLRHVQLWPEILRRLVKCHAKFRTEDKLVQRINPQIAIDLDQDASRIELSYQIQGDPEYRCYVVILREWEIAEFFTVE